MVAEGSDSIPIIAFPLELRDPWSQDVKTFESVKQLSDWASREGRIWEGAFANKGGNGPYFARAENRLQKTATTLVKHLSSFTDVTTASKDKLSSIRTYLRRFYDGTTLVSDSEVGKQVLKLLDDRKTDDAAALVYAATGMYSDPEIFPASNASEEETRRIAEKAELALRTLPLGAPTTVSIKAALEQSMGEIELLRAHVERIGGEFDTKQPINFWEDRAKNYGWLALTFAGLWLISLVVVACVVLFKELPAVQNLLHGTVDPSSHVKIDSGIEAWIPNVLAYAFVALLAIWVLRTLLRLAYASRELREDALERVTMLKTLLTLMDNKALPSDVRATVWPKAFDTIFRPQGNHRLEVDGPWDTLKAMVSAAQQIKGEAGRAPSASAESA